MQLRHTAVLQDIADRLTGHGRNDIKSRTAVLRTEHEPSLGCRRADCQLCLLLPVYTRSHLCDSEIQVIQSRLEGNLIIQGSAGADDDRLLVTVAVDDLPLERVVRLLKGLCTQLRGHSQAGKHQHASALHSLDDRFIELDIVIIAQITAAGQGGQGHQEDCDIFIYILHHYLNVNGSPVAGSKASAS